MCPRRDGSPDTPCGLPDGSKGPVEVTVNWEVVS